MKYEYICTNDHCEMPFEVIKRVAQYEDPEYCPQCGSLADRLISVPMLSPAIGDWGKEEFNPGLGCVTKNARHRKEIAKRKGVEEVGNDYGSGENHQVVHDKAREEKRRKMWDDL